MIEKLHSVSFYSIWKLAKWDNTIFISSRDETRLVHMLASPEIKYKATIYMICSSHESAEVLLFQHSQTTYMQISLKISKKTFSMQTAVLCSVDDFV